LAKALANESAASSGWLVNSSASVPSTVPRATTSGSAITWASSALAKAGGGDDGLPAPWPLAGLPCTQRAWVAEVRAMADARSSGGRSWRCQMNR
jgi:hypothetical protein